MTNEPIHIHADGRFAGPETCPKSSGGKCPECGHQLEGRHGLAGTYGLGTSYLCDNEECENVTIYDFRSDEG